MIVRRVEAIFRNRNYAMSMHQFSMFEMKVFYYSLVKFTKLKMVAFAILNYGH